jgi:hypothetical protein
MRTEDVYLLALHEPYESPDHPVPINATIVHALTLLHPAVPQPDGGRMYRCLTEFPGRAPGCLVPISTLTYELDGGGLWPQVADWEQVVETLIFLSRAGEFDSMPLGLPKLASSLLAMGPTTTTTIYYVGGGSTASGRERQAQINELAAYVRNNVAQAPFNPGANLVPPPSSPPTMPYKPYDP